MRQEFTPSKLQREAGTLRNHWNDTGKLGLSLGLMLSLSFGLFGLSQAAPLDLAAAPSGPQAAPSGSQAAPLDLKTQMSSAEYRAAGLDRLTDAQRAALNTWLAKHAVRQTKATATSNTHSDVLPVVGVQPKPVSSNKTAGAGGFGDEQLEVKVAEKPEVALAQIAGDFRGWDGKTLFRLTNGQVWQQRVGGRYRYRAVDPQVRIQRARFGYYLEITATGRKVGVKRIK